MFERYYWAETVSQTLFLRFIVWESEQYSVEFLLSVSGHDPR